MISVLYIDDEPLLLDIGKLFLENTREFVVETALSAPKGLELLSQIPCDVIVSDFQMPEMDGIEFLKEVRHRFGPLPFILFTGKGREEVVIQAINHGADFYLQKGGDPKAQFAELTDKIKKAVERRQVLDALRNSEQRLSDIINFLPDATFAIDAEGKIIAWNKAIEEMTGSPAGAMIGKGDYEYAIPFYGERCPVLADLIFESGASEHRHRYTILRKDGDVLTAETSVEHPAGRTRTFFCKASPLFDENGTITGSIESIRDITEQKQAEMELRAAYEQISATEAILRKQYNTLLENQEEIQAASAELQVKEQFLFQDYEELRRKEKAQQHSENLFQAVLDIFPCAIYIETEGKFGYINTSAVQLLCAGSPDELVGMNIRDWIHPEESGTARQNEGDSTGSRNLPEPRWEGCTRGKGSRVELEILRVPFFFRQKPAMLVFLRDCR